MTNLTEDQIKITRIVVNLFIKFLYSIAALIAFLCILFKIFNLKCDWKDNLPWAIVEAVLAGTLYQVFSHYFPKTNHSPGTTDLD